MGFTEFLGWALVSLAIIPHIIFELGDLYIRASVLLFIFGILIIFIGRAERKQNKQGRKKNEKDKKK